MKYERIAIDISKHVFTLHGVDAQERPVLRRNLKRADGEPFFGKLAATEVVMEACGGAHHWGPRAEPTGPPGTPHSSAIRQAVRQTRQERPRRCRSDQHRRLAGLHDNGAAQER